MSEHRKKALVVSALLAGMVVLPGCDRLQAWLAPDRCVLSKREIHHGMEVHVEVPEREISGEACCLRCALTFAEQTGEEVRVEWVTDNVTGEHLLPEKAFYVVGSRVSYCEGARVVAPPDRRELLERIWDRCAVSTIAFADRAHAEAFREREGGRVETFAQVVGSARVRADDGTEG